MQHQIVSLDTAALIWGIKGQASDGQKHLIAPALELLEKLRKDNTRVVLATQVVAEYLAGFEKASQKIQLQKLKRDFILAPLNSAAALIAAELWDDAFVKSLISKPDADARVTRRQVIKADITILSSSIAQ